MKQIKLFIFSLTLIALFTGCGMSTALIANHNQNSTQVHLTTNNFKVIEKVSGTSEVEYVFMIGGLEKRQLYENAYSAMLDKAKLINSSRAVINILKEEHVGGVPPFYYKRTVTVSGYVVEFTR